MPFCAWITPGQKSCWHWAICIEMLIHGQSGRLWGRCQSVQQLVAGNNCSECICEISEATGVLWRAGWLVRGADAFQKLPASLGTCIHGWHAQMFHLFAKWKLQCIFLNYVSPPAMILCIILGSRLSWGCQGNIFSMDLTNQCLRSHLTPSRPPKSCRNIFLSSFS